MHFLLPLMMAVNAGMTPIPIILDTDLGDDIDDTWALCMLLGRPDVDVKLIVTASDDTATKTRLVAKMLQAIGRTDIPIGTGLKTSERPINQAEWLGEYDLKDYPGTVHEDGIGAMIAMIMASPEMINLCVIGPQSNMKPALERQPEIARKARVVAMAGSVHIGYEGKEGRVPEWNVMRDPVAAQATFAAPWEIVLAPLDICGTLKLEGDRYLEVANADSSLARVLIENYNAWTNRKHYAENASSVLFDTVAAYLCYSEAVVETETIKLSVDDKGNTIPDEENGRPVRVALRWKDRDAFERELVKAIVDPAPNAEEK